MIRPSEADDAFSMMLDDDDDDGNVVFVDHMIQSGWNSVNYDSLHNDDRDSGILIVPAGPGEVSTDRDEPLLSERNSNVYGTNGNLSVPSSVPTSLPTVSADGFTNVLSNLTTNDEDGSTSPSKASVAKESVFSRADSLCSDVVGAGNNFVARHGNRIVLFVIFFTSVVSLSTFMYLFQERSVWRATTIRLEETVRVLQQDADGRLQVEEEKVRAREQAAYREQLHLTARLEEVMTRLKDEDDARKAEKAKAESLEREVLRLQEEVVGLGEDSRRAKELEQMVVRLRVEAEAREADLQRTAKLEEELHRLQIDLIQNYNTFQKKQPIGSDESGQQSFWRKSSTGGAKSGSNEHCTAQDFGEYARKASSSMSQKVKEWSETLSSTHERVKERMAQDYHELKEMFQGGNDKSEEKFFESRSYTNSDEEKFGDADRISKIWNNLGETLAEAKVRVMDQMVQDYSDLKSWYNEFSSGNSFESNEQSQQKTTHDSNERTSNQQTEKSSTASSQEGKSGVPTPEDNNSPQPESDSNSHMSIVRESAKTILYGAAFGAIATVAVDLAGSWFGSVQED